MSGRVGSSKLKLDLHESDDEVDKGDDCGISLEKLNVGPRKKLLVLNMGGLLLHKDQSDCTDTGFKALENEEKPIFLKQLKKLWDKDKSSLPWPKGRYSSSNTLLIDDTPYKSLLNPSNTAIFLPQYDANYANDKALGPSRELRLFLEGLADADDVPTYVKEHRIGQPEITSMHPDWKFYSKIINKFRGRKDGSSAAGRKD
ncbi:hypothetical protein HHK36_018089 [Tetracentron sinense]|uniref:FCP1 homology domain-containing protein n=1 Tax=Tetracentron sinense TaxID=13715 RepID=A0A835DAY4_TETSI|nr:hypothetical protein HHK36_018089 [Tetracentron sinense]